jgi:hypothetical protein
MAPTSREGRPPARSPTGRRCECCGAGPDEIKVLTYAMPLGVLCVCCCPSCARAALNPPITIAAPRLADDHEDHSARPPRVGPIGPAPDAAGPRQVPRSPVADSTTSVAVTMWRSFVRSLTHS